MQFAPTSIAQCRHAIHSVPIRALRKRISAVSVEAGSVFPGKGGDARDSLRKRTGGYPADEVAVAGRGVVVNGTAFWLLAISPHVFSSPERHTYLDPPREHLRCVGLTDSGISSQAWWYSRRIRCDTCPAGL